MKKNQLVNYSCSVFKTP